MKTIIIIVTEINLLTHKCALFLLLLLFLFLFFPSFLLHLFPSVHSPLRQKLGCLWINPPTLISPHDCSWCSDGSLQLRAAARCATPCLHPAGHSPKAAAATNTNFAFSAASSPLLSLPGLPNASQPAHTCPRPAPELLVPPFPSTGSFFERPDNCNASCNVGSGEGRDALQHPLLGFWTHLFELLQKRAELEHPGQVWRQMLPVL